jgi:phage protein D
LAQVTYKRCQDHNKNKKRKQPQQHQRPQQRPQQPNYHDNNTFKTETAEATMHHGQKAAKYVARAKRRMTQRRMTQQVHNKTEETNRRLQEHAPAQLQPQLLLAGAGDSVKVGDVGWSS